MSQMLPFLRGYRQALRDVQRVVLVCSQTMSDPASVKAAVSAAADSISVPLRQLRQSGIEALNDEAREKMAAVSSSQSDYVRGYQVGFDQATEIVAGWGRKMNDPVAIEAIAGVVTHLWEQTQSKWSPTS